MQHAWLGGERLTKVRWLVLLVIAVVILLVAGSCDPGWGYDVPDTAVEDDFSFVLPSQAGIKFQIWGYLFASNLWMELEVTNQSDQPISVDPGDTRVLDATGKALDSKGEPACRGSPNLGIVQLAKGETCPLETTFDVKPLVGIWPKANPDLRSITFIQDGISRQGQRIPVRVRMESAK